MNKTWFLFFWVNVDEFSMKINRSTRNSNKKTVINNILKLQIPVRSQKQNLLNPFEEGAIST